MTLKAIRLSRDELEDPLPQICMITGEDTEETVVQKFRWTPGWVHVLILAGFLVYVIVYIVATKKMTVRVPVVAEHKNYWKRRGLITTWLVLSSLGSLIGGFVAGVSLSSNNSDTLSIIAVVFGIAMFLALLIGASMYSQSGVHVNEITESSIKFAKAHPRFIEAVLDERELRDEEDRAWRAKRRAEREAEAPPPSNADAEERDNYYRKKGRYRESDRDEDRPD